MSMKVEQRYAYSVPIVASAAIKSPRRAFSTR
jgi:hypothetical protein